MRREIEADGGGFESTKFSTRTEEPWKLAVTETDPKTHIHFTTTFEQL